MLLRLCELQWDVELGDNCFTCIGELDFSSWRESKALFFFILSILWKGRERERERVTAYT